MKTTMIFIRHGEAEGNSNRRFHGSFDSSLTENGKLQIALTAQELDRYPIDVILSSDLKRTMDTAQAIAERKSLPVHPFPALREINGGDWEDVPFRELPIRFPEEFYCWDQRMDLLQMPNGESAIDFQKRVVDAICQIRKTFAGQNICVVTHGTVIKMLLCFFKNIPLQDFCKQNWHDNASITVVEEEKGTYRVRREGYNAHLGSLGTIQKQN